MHRVSAVGPRTGRESYGKCRIQLCRILSGVFTPVLAKHSMSFLLIGCILVASIACSGTSNRCGSEWKLGKGVNSLTVTAKVVIYEAFVEAKLEAPKRLAALCTISTSSRSTKSPGSAPSGVCRMRSRLPSKNWIPFLSSKLLLRWANSWRFRFSPSF